MIFTVSVDSTSAGADPEPDPHDSPCSASAWPDLRQGGLKNLATRAPDERGRWYLGYSYSNHSFRLRSSHAHAHAGTVIPYLQEKLIRCVFVGILICWRFIILSDSEENEATCKNEINLPEPSSFTIDSKRDSGSLFP